MPATYAHVLITDRALTQFSAQASLDRVLRGVTLEASHFVHLGCVSPDYPYLDFQQPQQARWADHMHYDQTGDVLKTMVQALGPLHAQGTRQPEFFIPFSWSLGYLSHVTADLVVHPVVRDIVGDYDTHKPEHRECEMLQDVYIYYTVRTGAEIRHSEFLGILRNCADPAHPDRVHPLLKAFWGQALHARFPEDYAQTPPAIDEWDAWYQGAMGVAGRPPFLGRRADPEHKYTYKLSTEITPEERAKYIERLPLPDGTTGTYDTLFAKAVTAVVSRWVDFVQALSTGDPRSFLASLTNCNLDTGTDNQTGRLVWWA